MAEKTEEHSRLPHALADKAMAAIVTKGLGAKAAVPTKVFAALKQELAGHVGDDVIFEDLCVMWFRLKEGGLLVAAQQMLELAAIGLKPAEVEAMVSETEALHDSAGATTKKNKTWTAAARELKPGGKGGGFGLRGRKK